RDARVEQARRHLLTWDYRMDAASVPAGIYAAWEAALRDSVTARVVPPGRREVLRGIPLSRVITWLVAPPGEFGANPTAARDSILLASLGAAVSRLTGKLGADMAQWRWGQERYHHALIRHPLSEAVSPELRRRLDVGPLPRGGYGATPLATGNGDNQTSGASFKIVVDTGDWDRTVGANAPGQSGDPDSPHYRDLFETWATDRFFPVFYSRGRVEAVTEARQVLTPAAPPGGR
ncbi:MAG TPA: penicillin acylase family protein, partial [Gemmatimonadales bacterium]|nr:penicillin acylase family protein [Gemmatimonadales bacterium]